MMMKKIILICSIILSFGLYNVQAQETQEEKDLIKLAVEISNQLYKSNYTFYDELFDIDAFLDRVFINDAGLSTYNADFKEGFKSTFTWGREFVNHTKKGGLYEPISFVVDENDYYVTFSLFGNEGLNYHELLFNKVDDQYRIVDVYVYSNGENLSETIKYFYLGGIESSGLLNQLSGKSKSFVKEMESILNLKTLLNAGKYKELNTYLEQASDAFKNTKMYYSLKTSALVGLGDSEAYYAFLRANSSVGVPTSFLTNIDLFFLESDWPAYQENINILDNFVGGDPVLNNYRGNGFLTNGNIKEAKIAYQQLYDDFPDYSYGVIGLLNTGLESGDVPTSITAMRDLYDRFGFTKQDLENAINSYPAIKNAEKVQAFIAALQ